jgi:hypothetical protein
MRTNSNNNMTRTPQRLLVTSVLPAAFLAFLAFGLTRCSDSGLFSSALNVDLTPLEIPVGVAYKSTNNRSIVSAESGSTQGLNLAGGLGLTSADSGSLIIDVVSCASGYSVTGASLSGSGTVALYKLDSGCDVVLTSFGFSSVTYNDSNTGASAFAKDGSLAKNDVATFAESGGDTIKVFLTGDITDGSTAGVDAGDAITYSFTDLEAGTTESLAQGSVSESISISVSGQAAPNFDIIYAYFIETNANGSADLSFTLECGVTISSTSCDGVEMLNTSSLLDFALVVDTYNDSSETQGALTVAQLNTAFGAATPDDIDNSADHMVVAATADDWNSQAVANGGFHTEEDGSKASVLVTGTSPFYNDAVDWDTDSTDDRIPYVFILRRRDSGGNVLSYKYFYVNLAPLVQS